MINFLVGKAVKLKKKLRLKLLKQIISHVPLLFVYFDLAFLTVRSGRQPFSYLTSQPQHISEALWFTYSSLEYFSVYSHLVPYKK